MSSVRTPAVPARSLRGRAANSHGRDAEGRAAAALEAAGWEVKLLRARTKAGEIDIVAEKDGLLAFVEVKARALLADAAEALSVRQRARLLKTAEILLAEHPEWGRNGVRFDVMVVDARGTVRRIRDAFRLL